MKYVPSALIGQLSRSQGSTTASHNRFGAYLRNRVIPTNPNTSKQAAARNTLAAASQGWRALNETQRDGWTALGSQMIRLDTLGQEYTLTGLQAYSSQYRNNDTVGNTLLTDPPILDEPTSLTSLTLTADDTPALSVAFGPSPLATGEKIVIEATDQVSAGKSFMPRSAYKTVFVGAAASTTPANILSAWNAIYGSLVLGSKIFIRAYVIGTNGQASVPLLADDIVIEGA